MRENREARQNLYQRGRVRYCRQIKWQSCLCDEFSGYTECPGFNTDQYYLLSSCFPWCWDCITQCLFKCGKVCGSEVWLQCSNSTSATSYHKEVTMGKKVSWGMQQGWTVRFALQDKYKTECFYIWGIMPGAYVNWIQSCCYNYSSQLHLQHLCRTFRERWMNDTFYLFSSWKKVSFILNK